MAINFQNLEYFAVSARTGSYRAAASELYRSYQSVYLGVLQLEEELGHDLFIRGAGGLQLTDYGQYVLREHVQVILDHYGKLPESYTEYIRQAETGLLIELDRYAHRRHVQAGMEAAEKLRQRHPEAQISCKLEDPDVVVRHVTNGEADLILRLHTPVCGELEPCLTLHTELHLYVGKGHRLAGRERVTIDEVREETFLFRNPKLYDKMSFWELTGISRQRAVLLDWNNPVTKKWFDSGMIVRVSPYVAGRQSTLGSLYEEAVRLSFDPPLVVEECFMKHPDAPLKALAREYLQLFQQQSEQALRSF